MCPGRELGLHMIVCLKCKKAVDPERLDKSSLLCQCDDGIKVRYEGNGVWSEPKFPLVPQHE